MEKQSQKPGIHLKLTRWSLPPPGWMKANIDATVFTSMDCVGFSCVIKKDTSVGARAKRISANLPPREAETAALKEVFSWTKEFGMRKCIFETDAKMLADACRGMSGRSFFIQLSQIVLNFLSTLIKC